jgi:hypothetical protein
MKSRLGCFTTSGLLAAILTLVVVVGIGLAQGGVLYNPGELNAERGAQAIGGVFSHAETGGRCSACHSPFWSLKKMGDLCLECHTNLVQDPKDFHRVMLAQSQFTACHHCHSDHNGPQGALTSFDLDQFPHDKIGFSLQAHQKKEDGTPFICEHCHNTKITEFDQASCAACHLELAPDRMQTHQQAFGTGCLACHDGLDSYGEAFDHNQAVFRLEEKHGEAACQACHAEARTIEALKSAPQECIACHSDEDIHQGEFGQDCAGCHTPLTWEGATFDHSSSGFPLEGGHARVECKQCHALSYAGTPTDCFACHAQDDAHLGQYGQACAGCHSPASWEATSFDHSKAAFPLTGAHLQAACDQCHANAVFKGTPLECSACHADPPFHLGLFGLDCRSCHSTEGWSPARYERPHTFPINHGESGPSPCIACHTENLTTYTCYAGCHAHDPNEIAEEHLDEGISDFQDCMRCHPSGEEGESEGD